MLVPVSWLKQFVDINVPVEVLAERLTGAGLEVGHIHYVGLPQTFVEGIRWPKSDHLVWDRSKLLLGAIKEVKAHPNADRLVLAMVDYGAAQLEQCVTGAPNLFEYRDKGLLDPPLWTVIALEGAEVWDGHSDTPKRMILKEKPLRGIPNRSMVCSEKELGISDSHEGIILMHENPGAKPGTPAQDVLGDVILEIDLTPNLARAYSILGVAREAASLLDVPLREPSYDFVDGGAPIAGQVSIEIRVPELNPRFTMALLRDTTIQPSPEWMQRRLIAVGQRPINNIVDVTNYLTFEIGQPTHAYDYDKLVARAGGKAPHIITRQAKPGEQIRTLDEVDRTLDDFTVLVTDEAGALGIGGIIGGADTEISASTQNVLLEAANWNFINVRRSMQAQKINTDAGLRFSRGVHPTWAERGVKRGIELMRQSGGGTVAKGIIDDYPLKAETVKVSLPAAEIERILGVPMRAKDAAELLQRGGFTVKVNGDTLDVTVPDIRLDIGTGIVGQADLIEEIGRIYGYAHVPNTIITDAMPPQRGNPPLELEERVRDLLVALGLRENISYRLTTPEREALLIPPGAESSLPTAGYVTLANPIASDKVVMRHTIMANLLTNAQANARFTDRQATFEIGAIYLDHADQNLPDEPRRLSLLVTGPRTPEGWMNHGQNADAGQNADFFDLKGVVEELIAALRIPNVSYSRAQHTTFHPGRSALLKIGETEIGVFGEVHPLVAQAFDLSDAPLLLAEFDLDALLSFVPDVVKIRPLTVTPPVLQDIALVVKGEITGAQVEAVIKKAGGDLLKEVALFDVYQGDPIPAGYQSLAYHLTYQTDARTLTDQEVATVHQRIVRTLKRELEAELRE
ncbi:MAG TPA: phenylalanine--tRNA ligase subunit beta [Phototrophicaceae bacterium]|nr:phenylalanine--tRNA ligase subunit beta [Phototrophicaceae bacterium]